MPSEAADFAVEVVDEHWLFKAHRAGIDVDVIFRATRDILFDDEMAARVTDATIYGRVLPVVAAEDLIVMKALAAGEDTARYWYDAIAILAARHDLDWEHLLDPERGSTRVGSSASCSSQRRSTSSFHPGRSTVCTTGSEVVPMSDEADPFLAEHIHDALSRDGRVNAPELRVTVEHGSSTWTASSRPGTATR